MTEQDLEAILEEVEAYLTASLFKRLVDTIESVRAAEKAKDQKQIANIHSSYEMYRDFTDPNTDKKDWYSNKYPYPDYKRVIAPKHK